jgi:hypothetical protein
VWLLVMALMVVLAISGPVIMVRDRLAGRAATPSAAEGAQPAAAAAGGAGGARCGWPGWPSPRGPSRWPGAVTDGFDYFCTIHPTMAAKIAVTG